MIRKAIFAKFLLRDPRCFAVFQMLLIGLCKIVVAVVVGDEEIVVRVRRVQRGVYRFNSGVRYRTCREPLAVVGVVKLIILVRLILAYIRLDAAL